MAEYIERDAALKAVCAECRFVPESDRETCPYKFTGCKEYSNVFCIPVAEVRPVMYGKWVPMNKIEPIPGYKCSRCGVATMKGWMGKPVKPPFCWNCGTDMRKSHHEYEYECDGGQVDD